MYKSIIQSAILFPAMMTFSGVNPNVERLCFSGNRDTLLDSHLSTLGANIITLSIKNLIRVDYHADVDQGCKC